MNEITPIQPLPMWLRVLRNPLVRIIVFFLLLIALTIAVGRLVPAYPPFDATKDLAVHGPELWIRALFAALPAALAYWLLVRVIEGRRLAELAPRKALLHGAAGWLVGMGILLAAAGVMALAGVFRVRGFHADANLIGPLVVFGLLPGITEEIVVRGILFRVVEEGLSIPVSGFGMRGWLDSSYQGPELLSGGKFGAEASLLTVVVCVAVAAFFTRKAIQAGRIKAPFWRRPKALAPSANLEPA